MKKIDIENVLEKAIKGERKSVELLINIVKEKIFNISMYFTGDFHLAQDCTQEILIKLINNLSKLNDISKFENWSYSLASNYLRNFIRDNKKYAGISFETMEAESTKHLEADFVDKNDYSEIKELAFELKISCTTAMLMCLSKDDRILFLLSNLLGIKSKRISEILCISAEATRKRLSRANKKIKNFIDNNCGLLNIENSCNCRQRVNYAILQKRLLIGNLYFQNQDYLSNNEILNNKIEKMNNLEDIGEIFQNNPNYAINDSLLSEIYEISEI